MLRINLLPPYIYEGKKRRNVVILWVVALLAVIGGFIWWKTQLDAQAADFEKKKAEQEPLKAQKEENDQKTSAINAENAELKGKTDFITNSINHINTTYPPVFGHVKAYTTPNIVYSSFVPAQQQVQLTAWAPSLTAVGQYMMRMQEDPEIVRADVALTALGQYILGPNRKPLRIGAGTATGTAAGAPGGGDDIAGAGGFGGPRGGGPAGGGLTPASVGGSAAAGSSGAPPSFGPPTGYGGPGGPGGPGGRFSGAPGGAGQQQGAVGQPPNGGGYIMNITLTLAKPIPAAPAYPGGGQQGGQGGVPGPGGFPGGPGGAAPGPGFDAPAVGPKGGGVRAD